MIAIAAWPRMLDPDQAKAYVGGDKILNDLLSRKSIKPRAQVKGLTRYDRLELDAALDSWPGFSGTEG